MENTKIVKMAIVGAGLWGEAHASIYREHMFAEPVAVCDLNRPKAEALAKKFGIGRVYADCEEMLRECPCDAVAIVTPDFLHADIAVACARAGKHMIVEKPLATTRKDVFRMLEAIEKSGVRAMVDLHNRWNPPFNAVKQLVDSGRFGTPVSAHFRLNDCLWVATDMLSWVAQSSILWFLGSHSLDTMNWVIGDYPVEVYAAKAEGKLKSLGIDAVDTYLSTIKYSRGAIAHMENSWITPNGNPNVNDFKFNLLLTDGKFDVDASSHNLLQVTDGQRMITQDVLVKNTVFDKCAGFAYESIRSFVDKLVSGDEFHVTLREAANVTLALLAVMESAETGAPVRVERV
ncbi:MAG: Gfo/Idh/MocA family oxidoreductase [Clostridiales bacterium]|jgi:predicted dehydrogenase|nr:Gfo/Idh/MocA family oxidoreductase [Clostridiales bacterium]